MAEVFRAETRPVAGVVRHVAIKRLLYSSEQDPEAARMFIDEAEIWLRLRHPNIVPVVEFGESEDGSLFLALELIDGMSASELLRIGGALPIPIALCIAERIARALDHAHSQQIVHRDVKPANVLLSQRGEIFLTDFGIARAVNRSSRTQTGVLKGSVTTLTPEQVRGEKADSRSDLFALGSTLHQLVVNRRLIDAPAEVLFVQLAAGKIPAPPENLPEPVRDLLARLTAGDPAARPASAAEVAREIRDLLPASPDELEADLAERVKLVLSGHVPDRTADRPSAKPAHTAPTSAMEISAPYSAATAPRVEPLPKTGTTGFFETLPAIAKTAVARSPSRVGFFASAALVVLLAALLWKPITQRVRDVDCATTRLAILDVIEEKGARAAAESAAPFATKCPRESDGGVASVRLLALSGDSDAAHASLPQKGSRTERHRLAAATIDFASRDWARAENAALAIAKEAGPDWPRAACLASAAALNQDRPDRAESHLDGVPSDCARILRAASLAQRGRTSEARSLLTDRSSDVSLEAARESAIGVLDLQAGDMEAAAADALAASSAADSDRLSPRPWIWYLQPSPRSASENALRIAGPFDDAGLYTKVLEGDCARVRGNYDLALSRYTDAHARGGRTALADLRAAAVLVKQGKPQLARGRLARALEAEPGFAPALVALALIEERDSLDYAVQHARLALQSEPNNRDAQRIAARGR